MNDLPCSWSEAKRLGAAEYFTGVPCRHGHIAPRRLNGKCVECARKASRDYMAAFRANAPKENAERQRLWYATNPDRARLLRQRAYLATRESFLQRCKAYRAANAEAIRERKAARARETIAERTASHRRWRQVNRDRYQVIANERRSRNRHATPLWADRAANKAFYEIARRVSQCTGIRFEVDHIEPLGGVDRCGLHVPWNLRVIPASANQRKGNRTNEQRTA